MTELHYDHDPKNFVFMSTICTMFVKATNKRHATSIEETILMWESANYLDTDCVGKRFTSHSSPPYFRDFVLLLAIIMLLQKKEKTRKNIKSRRPEQPRQCIHLKRPTTFQGILQCSSQYCFTIQFSHTGVTLLPSHDTSHHCIKQIWNPKTKDDNWHLPEM